MKTVAFKTRAGRPFYVCQIKNESSGWDFSPNLERAVNLDPQNQKRFKEDCLAEGIKAEFWSMDNKNFKKAKKK